MTILFRDVILDDIFVSPGRDIVVYFSHHKKLFYNSFYPSGTLINDKLIHKSRKDAQKYMKKMLKRRNEE